MEEIKIPNLTRKEEHRIRRALMVGLGGWEYPPKVGHERQEDGWFPNYGTIRMAEKAMIELLTLKAEVAKFRAETAQIYAEKFILDEGEMPHEGKMILESGKVKYEEENDEA